MVYSYLNQTFEGEGSSS